MKRIKRVNVVRPNDTISIFYQVYYNDGSNQTYVDNPDCNVIDFIMEHDYVVKGNVNIYR